MRKIKTTINLLPIFIAVVGSIYVLCGGKTIIVLPHEPNFHFSLITVSSIFGGFLYTNYSLLIGLSDNHIIKKIKCTDIIKKRNAHIIKGIVYAVISVMAGLYFVFVPTNESKFQDIVSCFVVNVEVTFLGFLILYFLLSVNEIKKLVDSAYYSGDKKSDNEIKNLKEKIRTNTK